jgi:hypothetical protein
METFRELNQRFRPITMEITFRIDSLKEEIYNLLTGGKADSLQLQKLSEEIGQLHGRLKNETVRFYVRLNALCDSQQKEKLAAVFKPLFISEKLVNHGNNRNGPGWKRNQP